MVLRVEGFSTAIRSTVPSTIRRPDPNQPVRLLGMEIYRCDSKDVGVHRCLYLYPCCASVGRHIHFPAIGDEPGAIVPIRVHVHADEIVVSVQLGPCITFVT